MVLAMFRTFVIAAAAGAFGLAALGSWTRINGAGMTCPDWPLCQGAVVPVLHGGVILEWLHRLFVACESLAVAGVVFFGLLLRAAIPRLSRMVAAIAVTFALQVMLGAATIALANSPFSVMFHWSGAMLLLALLSATGVLAFSYDSRRTIPTFTWRRGTHLLLLASVWTFATMCLGAYVSSSGAGFACAGSIPGCGSTFFGTTSAETIQMVHRAFAATLVPLAIAAALVLPRTQRRAATAVQIALVFLGTQIVLGVLNVLGSLPMELREAHAVNAVVTFLSFVVATALASLPQSETVHRGFHRHRIVPQDTAAGLGHVELMSQVEADRR